MYFYVFKLQFAKNVESYQRIGCHFQYISYFFVMIKKFID